MRGTLRPLRSSNGGPAAGVMIAAFFAIVPLMVIPPSLAWHPIAVVFGLALVLVATAPIVGLDRMGSAFILVGFTTVTFNDVHPIPGVPWLEVGDPFFLIGFVLVIPRLLGNPLRLPPAFLVGAVGLLAVGTLSALLTEQPSANFSHLLDVVRGLVFLPIFFAWWQPGRRTIVALALAYMLGSCINVVEAIFEGATFDDRYAGLTTHPNTLGICLVLSISLAPFLLAELRARHHWVVGLMIAVCGVGIWLTGSRAAFACAALLVLLYPLFNRSIPAAISVGALSLAAFAVADRLAQHASPDSLLGRLLGEGSAAGSDEARREGARQGIDQFLAHPILGDGWLTVWGAHDGYIQVAAATGIFGLAFYLLLVAGLLRPLLAIAPPSGLLATPMLATVMLDIFLPVLGARYVWVVVALSLAADRLAAEEQPDAPVEEPLKPGPAALRAVRP
jgi:O-antigen ligase